MDRFAREDLRALLTTDASPAVSIFLTTDRSQRNAQENRLGFRDALERARQLLRQGNYSCHDCDATLGPLETLQEDALYWANQDKGLAAFSCPKWFRVYRVPTAFTDKVVVGSHFHVQPLVAYLQVPDGFWLLSVNQNHVQLYTGSSAQLLRVPVPGMSESLEDALGALPAGKSLQRHGARSASSVGSRGVPAGSGLTTGGKGPVFHGHGTGKDDNKMELDKFFRQLLPPLAETLRARRAPIILAAVDYCQTLFRHAASKVDVFDDLLSEGIMGNVEDMDVHQLHAAAWAIARHEVAAKRLRALDLWERSFGEGKTASMLSDVSQLAAQGRVRLLLVESDCTMPGHINRNTGEIRMDLPFMETTSPQDLLAEVTAMVLLRGGDALSFPKEQMPGPGGVAAILR